MGNTVNSSSKKARFWSVGTDQKVRHGPSWRFLIGPGTDGIQSLLRHLAALNDRGEIGNWYAVGSISGNDRHCALIEFDPDTDGMAAVLSWDASR
jgi:hypothetical protein